MDVQFSPEDIRPIVECVLDKVLERLDEERQALGKRLCYTEPEAARELRLGVHSLREERRRGKIQASQIVGRRIVYLRSDLLEYLARRRYEAK